MLVLNCYNDKSLNETKLELLSLICEYIQFHSTNDFNLSQIGSNGIEIIINGI